jgi:predicted PurR-regulated permease PerM
MAGRSNGADSGSSSGSSSESTSLIDTQVSVRSVSLTIIAICAAMYVLHWAQEVFIPIVLSILISYALEPIVVFLMRTRMPRALASALVVGSLTLSFVYTGYSLADEATAVVAELPAAATKLRMTLRRERTEESALEQVKQAAAELQKTAEEATTRTPVPRGVQRVQIEAPAFDVREYISWGSASIVAFAGQAVLIVFFVFFLLASGDLFKRKLVRIVGPSLERKKVTVQILDEINAQIARFLFVRVVTSVAVGVATWIAFRMIGLEQAGVWGIAAGLFNSIPYFGPVIVAAGTAVIAFLQFGTISMALFASGVSLGITSLEGWILTPWLTSRTARTNEVAVFIALIFWGFVWGLWGTLLAVPIMVAVKACCDRIEELNGFGEMLGN